MGNNFQFIQVHRVDPSKVSANERKTNFNEIYGQFDKEQAKEQEVEDEKDSGQWDPQLIREFIGLISNEQRVRHIHCIDENVLDIKSGESLRPVPLESS